MARRQRRLEKVRSMRVSPGGLLELAQAIDQYTAFLGRGVRLFTEARDQGCFDEAMAQRAKTLSATMLAQLPTFENHVARWAKEPLTPEARREVVRLAREMARCRLLGETFLDIPTRADPHQPPRRRRGRSRPQ
jgi:hypothetical protein